MSTARNTIGIRLFWGLLVWNIRFFVFYEKMWYDESILQFLCITHMSPESLHPNIDPKKKNTPEIKKAPNSPERDAILIESKIKRYTLWVESLEWQIKQINELRRENTWIIGGVGDWIGEKTWAYATWKENYEDQLKQAQGRAKTLHLQIVAEHFEAKNLSDQERAKIEQLLNQLEKASGAKLEHVSWWKAVFNSAWIDDIKWDTGSVVNRAKIFSRTVISTARSYASTEGPGWQRNNFPHGGGWAMIE